MRFFFLDDSRQRRPSRVGVAALVGIGGFSVADEHLKTLEMGLEDFCVRTGFPRGEEFKWSPDREMWMHGNLTEEARTRFFEGVIEILAQNGAIISVVASETNCRMVTDVDTHEKDVTNMFLERAYLQLRRLAQDGVVIIDRPGGNRRDEDVFLASCVETLLTGTTYVRPDRFALNVLTSSSIYHRTLQAADLIAGATLSRISGETNYSPPVFRAIRPLLDKNNNNSSGGTGLKLHPDARLLNLYYWLLGENRYYRTVGSSPLPRAGYLFFGDDGIPVAAA